MKLVAITRGLFAKVDDDDYALVQPYAWCATGGKGKFYARAHRLGTHRNSTHVLMHRLVLGLHDAPRAVQVDHINGDTLDNRRANLRVASASLNQANREFKRSASGFKGVSQRGSVWRARIGKAPRIHLGQFASADAAARAYDAAAREMFGEFARLNFPQDGERGVAA